MAELFGQELINTLISGILLIQKVDNYPIELLAVSVASAASLLDAMGVPRQVVIDHQVAKLEIDAPGWVSVAMKMDAWSWKFPTIWSARRLSSSVTRQEIKHSCYTAEARLCPRWFY